MHHQRPLETRTTRVITEKEFDGYVQDMSSAGSTVARIGCAGCKGAGYVGGSHDNRDRNPASAAFAVAIEIISDDLEVPGTVRTYGQTKSFGSVGDCDVCPMVMVTADQQDPHSIARDIQNLVQE